MPNTSVAEPMWAKPAISGAADHMLDENLRKLFTFDEPIFLEDAVAMIRNNFHLPNATDIQIAYYLKRKSKGSNPFFELTSVGHTLRSKRQHVEFPVLRRIRK